MENSKTFNCQNRKLYIMVGIPASGKSTWARAQVSNRGAYVSRDFERYRLLKDSDEYFSKEKQVYRNFVNEIKKGLENYEEIYVDATHINKPSRNKIMNSLRGICNGYNVEYIAVYRDTPFETCLERNSNREGRTKIPYDQMESINRFKSKPKVEEGFNKILTIKGE
ncbi:MAG: ATP-binding protein [Cellulosilyticaceae bacterium]